MAIEKRLIDANVVLAKKFTTGLSDASGNYYGYADVVFADDIENAPIVDAVEVVHGRWKPELMPTGVEYTGWAEMTVQALSCSECGILIDVGEGYFAHCPNCGAKMDGDGNDS